jgi:hypothetical protein
MEFSGADFLPSIKSSTVLKIVKLWILQRAGFHFFGFFYALAYKLLLNQYGRISYLNQLLMYNEAIILIVLIITTLFRFNGGFNNFSITHSHTASIPVHAKHDPFPSQENIWLP